MAAPGPGAFGAFGVGAAVSVGRGAGHGGARAGAGRGGAGGRGRAAAAAAGGVCARALRGYQRPARTAFSMPLASAGRANRELRLRAEPEISGDTAHTTGEWTPEEPRRGLCPTAVGPRSGPASLPAPPRAPTDPLQELHKGLQPCNSRGRRLEFCPKASHAARHREGDPRSREDAEWTGREKKDSSCCVKEQEVPARLHAFLGARCGGAPAEPRTCRHVSARAAARAQRQPRLAKAAAFPPGGPPGAGGRGPAAAPRRRCKWPHPPLSPSSSAGHPGD